jgi:hypothetical protein
MCECEIVLAGRALHKIKRHGHQLAPAKFTRGTDFYGPNYELRGEKSTFLRAAV